MHVALLPMLKTAWAQIPGKLKYISASVNYYDTCMSANQICMEMLLIGLACMRMHRTKLGVALVFKTSRCYR